MESSDSQGIHRARKVRICLRLHRANDAQIALPSLLIARVGRAVSRNRDLHYPARAEKLHRSRPLLPCSTSVVVRASLPLPARLTARQSRQLVEITYAVATAYGK